MDEDFTKYLARRGITESKYLTFTGDAQATVIAAFEKSKEGNCRNCFTDFRIIYSVVSYFRESFVTISQQYPTTTHIPIESLRTCATILCLGVTIIYGCVQSAMLWYEEIKKYLILMCLVFSLVERPLFAK